MRLRLLIVLLTFTFCHNASWALTIGLVDGARSSYVAVSEAGQAIDGKTGKVLLPIQEMCRYDIKESRRGIAIRLSDRRFYNTGTDYLIITSGNNGFVSSKEKWYRGNLIVKKTDDGLTIINDIGLEDYLLGVVPAEMPASWDTEALKAQAIAARSYTLANLGKRIAWGYDLKDTPEDQAYNGASGEKEKTTRAVFDTKGKVLVYDGKVINASYCASAGGRTRLASEVWNRELPYIHSVLSYDDEIGKKGHGVGLSQYGANFLAKNGYNAYQILNYFYRDVALGTIQSN